MLGTVTQLNCYRKLRTIVKLIKNKNIDVECTPTEINDLKNTYGEIPQEYYTKFGLNKTNLFG